MAGIKDLFVSGEIASELWQLGFDEPCIGFYSVVGLITALERVHASQGYRSSEMERDACIGAPLYQQVIDWFREKHNLDLSVINTGNRLDQWEGRILSVIFNDNTDMDWDIDDKFQTYYECLDNTILEAIKIIKR